MKLVNTYDATTGKNVMSLYRDGVLVVADIQKSTGDFNSNNAGMSLEPYPIDSNMTFAYLGCNNGGSFLLTMQIDYIKVDTNVK